MMSLHKFLGCTWCNRKSLLQTAWLCRSNTPLNRVSARVKPQSRSSTNRMVLAYIGAVRKCSKEGKARGYIAAEFHTPWLFLTSLQGLRSGKGGGPRVCTRGHAVVTHDSLTEKALSVGGRATIAYQGPCCGDL